MYTNFYTNSYIQIKMTSVILLLHGSKRNKLYRTCNNNIYLTRQLVRMKFVLEFVSTSNTHMPSTKSNLGEKSISYLPPETVETFWKFLVARKEEWQTQRDNSRNPSWMKKGEQIDSP